MGVSVAIIDYGVGNLRSVEKAFQAGGADSVVTSDERVLRDADKLVLPGVGAFRACMKALNARGFDRLVRERVAEGTPLLGVCVGMQMLFEESEEFGTTSGRRSGCDAPSSGRAMCCCFKASSTPWPPPSTGSAATTTRWPGPSAPFPPASLPAG